MFEKIKALLSGKDLIRTAYDDTFAMLDLVASLYGEATGMLIDGTTPSIDIHKEDKQINIMEQDIRRNILAHLSVNPQVEVSASLILSAVVGYIERVGDYAKNIEELAETYGQPLRSCEAAAPLVEATAIVFENIGQTREAFANEDKELATAIMKRHKKVRKTCGRVLDHAFASETADKNEALVCVMYARYLKRVSAGLKNIATTVVVPFDYIGYTKITSADDE